jgi:hypothetical protein
MCRGSWNWQTDLVGSTPRRIARAAFQMRPTRRSQSDCSPQAAMHAPIKSWPAPFSAPALALAQPLTAGACWGALSWFASVLVISSGVLAEDGEPRWGRRGHVRHRPRIPSKPTENMVENLMASPDMFAPDRGPFGGPRPVLAFLMPPACPCPCCGLQRTIRSAGVESLPRSDASHRPGSA